MAPRKGQLAGDRNPNWHEGRTIASNGYVLLKRPDHPAADSRGYVYEHRLVAETTLGRALRPGEIVHHLNHDKVDNRPCNLLVLASIAHHMAAERSPLSRQKHPDDPNALIACACGCGAMFEQYDRSGRPRRFVNGHNHRTRSG